MREAAFKKGSLFRWCARHGVVFFKPIRIPNPYRLIGYMTWSVIPTILLIRIFSQRNISEAKALLQHTSWNIADIAYALGFEYPSYFNNYFKRMTGTNPTFLRVQEV